LSPDHMGARLHNYLAIDGNMALTDQFFCLTSGGDSGSG